MVNSRQKGAAGEREFSHWLIDRGIQARRGQQFSGSPDSPDVVTELDDRVHFEVKRVERLELWPALAQAMSEAGSGKTPVVVHRRNRSEWVAILRMEDLLRIIRGKD